MAYYNCVRLAKMIEAEGRLLEVKNGTRPKGVRIVPLRFCACSEVELLKYLRTVSDGERVTIEVLRLAEQEI